MFARRTESLDAAELENLLSSDIITIFGNANIINIIEKSLLSVTIITNDGEIIGFASFYDYPRMQKPISEDWHKIYTLQEDISGYDTNNSLFMHYFIAVKDREISILTEIINTVFSTAAEIHLIFMNTNRGILPEIFGNIFKMVSNSKNSENWFVLKREAFMPRLFIRPAKQEDNDDLAPIFNAQTDVLQKIYGEFYLPEMIDAQSNDMKCLVAEVNNKAVGFICVTNQADLELLSTGFYLEPYQGFKKDMKTQIPEDLNMEESLNKSENGEEEERHEEEKEPKDQSLNEFSKPLSDQQQDSSSTDSDKSVSDKAEAPDLAQLTPFNLGSQELLRVNYSEHSHFSHFQQKSLAESQVIPYYPGTSNALIIQLFAIAEQYEMRSIDFLTDIFKLFPDRDYLLITVPHLVPEFTLLENFVRVTPRPGTILPHELYCFHKGSLYKDFSVRPVYKSDMEKVQNLIKNLNYEDSIIDDINQFHTARRFTTGIGLHCYLAICQNVIVGVAVLQDEEEIEYLRSHYNIEDFIYFTHHSRTEHGHLRHFAMNPIFRRLNKVFIKEIMRKSRMSSIYYRLYQPWADPKELISHSLVTCLNDMVPVRPRRQIVYPTEKLDGINWPQSSILEDKADGFCLTHLNRKLIMEPKVGINARIVVVGASTTGMGFLDYLCFCPHLRFNNLFLVSPNGLPDDYEDNDYTDQLLGTNFDFSKKILESSSMRIQVTVIKGQMTSIDRKKKRISINRRYLLPYDHLIITTGLQFTVPNPIDYQTKYSSKKITNIHRRHSEMYQKREEKKQTPENLYVVNDPMGANALTEFVKEHMMEEGYVIVYGASFEAFCCLHTLLDMGIHGSRIHFVKPTPPPDDNVPPINNPTVETAVYNILREASVNIYNNFLLAKFNDSDSMPDWLHTATFNSTNGEGPPLKLQCKLFINYNHKVVNYEAFQAMNDACLVFDSRLVIDTYFHTNDPSIRGAGPCTKYQRKFYADQWTHARFNSKHIGEELASTFLRLFDPTLEPLEKPPTEEVKLIPMYTDVPVVKSAVLPGAYLYLHVCKPALPTHLETLEADPNYGTVLITGHPDSENGYFRLHLNQYKKVETITCLSKQKYQAGNLIQLYGIHERALNNLLSRFNEGLVPDLFDFFTDTWAIAFYHDRFIDLREEINELLMTSSNICSSSFEEIIREAMSNGNELSVDERADLLRKYVETSAKKTVDQRLLSFIAYNYYHLPMYAKPDLV